MEIVVLHGKSSPALASGNTVKVKTKSGSSFRAYKQASGLIKHGDRPFKYFHKEYQALF
jgi:hypothetical protein